MACDIHYVGVLGGVLDEPHLWFRMPVVAMYGVSF